MPTIFRHDGYRFFFYSNEGDPREPVHVHVIKGGAEAKLWIDPDLQFADTQGFAARDLRRILLITAHRRDEIIGAWHDHFGD